MANTMKSLYFRILFNPIRCFIKIQAFYLFVMLVKCKIYIKCSFLVNEPYILMKLEESFRLKL